MTLTATKNDGNATVVITNDDDSSTPEEAELDLAVGSNTLTVTGATVTNARRVDGRKDLWELTLEPSATGPVSILVPQGRACAEAGALCTAHGRTFTTAIATRIADPLRIRMRWKGA